MEKDLNPIKELKEYSYTQIGGKDCGGSQVTLGEFVNSWFYEEYQLIVDPDTFRGCCFDMDHILAVFQDKIILELKMKDICLFYNGLEKGGFSQSTINNIHRLFSKLIYAVLQKGLIKFM